MDGSYTDPATSRPAENVVPILVVVTGEESEEETNMDTDHAAAGEDGPPPIPPLSASTPTRSEKQTFRIVDIVCSTISKNPGDENPAEGTAERSGDGNTADPSEANSAEANSQKGDAGAAKQTKEILIPDLRIRSRGCQKKFRRWSSRRRRNSRRRFPQKRMPLPVPLTLQVVPPRHSRYRDPQCWL